MAIDQTHTQEWLDRSYLGRAGCNTCVCVCVCLSQSLFVNLQMKLYVLSSGLSDTPPPSSGGISAVIDGRVSLSCFSPFSANSTHRGTKFMHCMQKGTLCGRFKRSHLSRNRGFPQQGKRQSAEIISGYEERV